MRKSMSTAIVTATALALTVGGCGKSGQDQTAADAGIAKQAIKADEAKWVQEFKAKDTEGLAGHYTEDAYFVAPGVTADGSTQIRQVFANASVDPAAELQLASDRIDVSSSGDLAYARGKFTQKYTDKKTGKVMTDSGTYLSVYKKQADGSWKMVEDVAAADPATVKPVPPEKPATRAKMVSF